MFDELVLKTFLDNQTKLFDEPVANDMDEANEFLEDSLALVVESLDEVRDYFDENMDITDLTDDELKEQSEVFPISDGRYLIVEG